MDEFPVWLIERRVNLSHEYLSVCGGDKDNSHKVSGRFQWTQTAYYALRFSRKEDACLFLGAFILLCDELPHKFTMTNLRSSDVRPEVTEHVFS